VTTTQTATGSDYNTAEAAQAIGISTRWVLRLVASGELPAQRKTRRDGLPGTHLLIPAGAVDQYVRNRQQATAGLISTAEAARRCGVAVNTMCKLASSGRVPAVQVRRQAQRGNPFVLMFDPAVIDRWVAEKPIRDAEAERRRLEGARKGSAAAAAKVKWVDRPAATPKPAPVAPIRPVRMQEPPTNKRPAPKSFRGRTDLEDARRLYLALREIYRMDPRASREVVREIDDWMRAHPKVERVPIKSEVFG
jgi:excisionase family DNA binding protein